MSQTLIDLDISLEEFKIIVNEKKKGEQMKESIRNIKHRDEISENSKDIKKNSGNAYFQKHICFCLVYIKWLKLLKKLGKEMV